MFHQLSTSNFIKNTPLRVVFSTLFSVFGYPNETLSLVSKPFNCSPWNRFQHSAIKTNCYTLSIHYFISLIPQPSLKRATTM